MDIGRSHLTGEPVIAHTAGKVVFCQTGHKNNKGAKGNASYGNCVKIDHGHGYSTLYAHLATVTVKNGENARAFLVFETGVNYNNVTIRPKILCDEWDSLTHIKNLYWTISLV